MRWRPRWQVNAVKAASVSRAPTADRTTSISGSSPTQARRPCAHCWLSSSVKTASRIAHICRHRTTAGAAATEDRSTTTHGRLCRPEHRRSRPGESAYDVSSIDNGRNGSIANDVMVTNRRPFGYPRRGRRSRRVTSSRRDVVQINEHQCLRGSPTRQPKEHTHDELFGIGVLL
jgi:hypothetical protein